MVNAICKNSRVKWIYTRNEAKIISRESISTLLLEYVKIDHPPLTPGKWNFKYLFFVTPYVTP